MMMMMMMMMMMCCGCVSGRMDVAVLRARAQQVNAHISKWDGKPS